MNCIGQHITPIEATGYVRYVRKVDGQERIRGPYCDGHQVDYCSAARWRERQGEIGELGAIPLDYAERLAEARQHGRVQRIREAIERETGTPEEIADAIMEALPVLEQGVRDMLRTWIEREREARAEAERDWQETNRYPY